MAVPDSSSNAEQSAQQAIATSSWRAYSTNRVAYPDLLSIPTEPGRLVASDAVVDNLKQRWRANLPYTSIAHQSLVVVPLPNNNDATKVPKKKKSEGSAPQADDSDVEVLENFLPMTKEEKALLVSDASATFIVNEHAQAHPFTFAARAYWHLVRDGEDQVIVFSGETGSGKTQTAHYIIRQLAHLSRSHTQSSQSMATVAYTFLSSRILSAITVYEAFTQAVTSQNPSSSRAHSVLSLQFTRQGRLVGINLTEMMLELRRAIGYFDIGAGERSFHVFYDMIAASWTPEERSRLFLQDSARPYNYLRGVNASEDLVSKKKKRKAAFSGPSADSFLRRDISVFAVFAAAGFSKKVQFDIFKIVSCVLLLGNIEFAEYQAKKDEGCYVKNTDVLEKCANLLGVSPEALESCLVQQTSTVGNTISACFLTIPEAKRWRDEFACVLYSMVFEYIVSFINKSLDLDQTANADESKRKLNMDFSNSITFLDFAGLENRGVVYGDVDGNHNHFWQFCTNFADERLHHWILENAYDFSVCTEKEANRSIGQVGKILVQLQQASMNCLDLYLQPGKGIGALLDAESLGSFDREQGGLTLNDIFNRNHGADKRASIFTRLESEGRRNAFIQGHHKCSFGVKHYGGYSSSQSMMHAAKVYYDSSDFLEVNRMGGSGTGSKGLRADYIRLFRGTADFKATTNRFLEVLVTHQVNVYVDQSEKKTVMAVYRKNKPVSQNTEDKKSLAAVATSPATSQRTTLNEVPISSDVASLEPRPSSAKLAPVSPLPPDNKTLESPQQGSNATPTTFSELNSSIETLLIKLVENGECRVWYVFCVRPCDDIGAKKISDDKVREQIRRLDIPLALSLKLGHFSYGLTWSEFWGRYGVLYKDALKAKGEVRSSKRRDSVSSLASVSRNAEQMNSLKEQCKTIYEAYAIVTAGGSGLVDACDKKVFLNERAWWALERNLVPYDSDKCKKDGAAEDSTWSAAYKAINGAKEVEAENQDLEEEEVKPIQKKKPEEVVLSRQRIWWLRITKWLTWWIRTSWIEKIGGMKAPEVQQAWREKVALCILIAFLSAVMLFLITGFTKLLCPTQDVFTIEDLSQFYSNQEKRKNYVAIHGKIYDFSDYYNLHPNAEQLQTEFNKYAGKDISNLFPRRDWQQFETEGFPGSCESLRGGSVQRRSPQTLNSLQNSMNSQTPTPVSSDSSTANTKSPGLPPEIKPFPFELEDINMILVKKIYCHVTTKVDYNNCHLYTSETANYRRIMNEVKTKRMRVYDVGYLGWDEGTVESRSSGKETWFILYDKVYDVTLGIQDGYSTFPESLVRIMNSYRGKRVEKKSESAFSKQAIACLDEQFFEGVYDTRNSIQCQVAGNSLLALTVVLCAVMAVKFLSALQLGARRMPENIDRFCILQVPCYTEGEESLRKTIDSLSLLKYDDEKKLLFIIADGLIKGSGNDRMTPELVLDIFGVENSHEKIINDDLVPRYDYLAIGEGMNRLNKGKVFSGLYEIQGRKIPYIVVIKCGKETETRRPGNRGKRDSQMILMKYLNKVFFNRPMCPLELEIHRHITEIIGVETNFYEFVLMVDADTEVLPDSLSRLVAVMLHDQVIMGLCGETQIGNEMESWVTMIQVYEYYISHHMAKAFESLFGSVTCLPGCFCMYRIKTPGEKAIPLLIDDQIIHDYEETNVDTLHKKNLLSLGEDRYLTTIMLKYFPNFRNKFTADAACRTIVPERIGVLLSQRRRWINSTIHNLWELLLIPQLCGCLCIGMRFVVLLDFFATLVMPASIGYLGYLIYEAINAQTIDVIVVSLYLLAGIYLAQALIFLLHRKWDMIGWMVIYLISLPVYGVYLPLYAFWNFDDFSWGNTRLVIGDKSGGHGGGDITVTFDDSVVKHVKYDDAKKQKGKKGPSEEVRKSSAMNHVEDRDVSEVGSGSFYDPSRGMVYSGMSMIGSTVPIYQYVPVPVQVPTYGYANASGTGGQKKVTKKPNLSVAEFLDAIPPPKSVPAALARLVLSEIIAIVSEEDLKTLTKRNVRERVERNLQREFAEATRDIESTRSDDMKELVRKKADVNLTHDEVRKEWVGKCIVSVVHKMAIA